MKRYIKDFYTKIPTLIIIALVIFAYRYITIEEKPTNSSVVAIEDVQKVFPSATKTVPLKKDNHHEVHATSGVVGKVIVNNSDSVFGYAGKVPIIIGVDNSSKIKDIAFLANSETPSFINRINSLNFMQKWNGKLLSSISADDVDAISGATMTTEAVIKNVLAATTGSSDSRKTLDIKNVQKVFPTATSVKEKDELRDVYDVFANDTHLGKVALNYSDSVYGYGGRVPIIIAIENRTNIKSVAFMPNNETPGFITMIEKRDFMKSWDGKDISNIAKDDNSDVKTGATKKSMAKKSVKVSGEVDIITGATMTTSAVIKNVETTVKALQKVEGSGFSFSKKVLKTSVLSVVLILSLLLYSSIKFKHHQIYVFKKYRAHIQIIEVVFLGFLSGTMLSMFLFESWIINGVNFFTSPITIIIAALAILIPIFTHKPYYCVYVCPFGAMQELTNKLAMKLKIPQKKLPKYVKHVRMGFFVITIITMFFIKTVSISDMEPFPAFLFKAASTATLSIAITFIILSLFYKNPWCRIFCPTGSFLDILKKPFFLFKK